MPPVIFISVELRPRQTLHDQISQEHVPSSCWTGGEGIRWEKNPQPHRVEKDSYIPATPQGNLDHMAL